MSRLDKSELTLVSVATLVGLAIRIAAVAPAAFPLNDGGLFYTMIEDLLASHLRMPAFTTYNAISIPYAYPPLAFYFYAILNLTTRIPLLSLMQYGPAIISCASIPAFYLLARDMLGSKAQAALSTLVFMLLPRGFDWLIMGGGVTRSLGMFFALLAMRQAFLLSGRRSAPAVFLAVVCGSLVVYSHPEASVHTAISAILFYLWKDRSRRGFMSGLLVAAGVLALTAPWWGSVISAHGTAPFLAASSAAKEDSYTPLIGLFALFRFEFADEPFVTMLTVLGLVGVFVALARRQFLVPAWLFFMHVLEPRGGTLFMMIPLSMSAGLALDQVLLPAFGLADRGASSGPDEKWLDRELQGRWSRIFLGFVLVYGIMSAFATGLRIQQEFTLTAMDLRAFAWVRDNTNQQARFALVTRALPLRDAASEWFPALTGRQSTGTVFGFEWILEPSFAERIQRYETLQACATEGPDCLQAWSQQQSSNFDYVYITNPAGVGGVPLEAYLADSADYKRVYFSSTVAIYQPR